MGNQALAGNHAIGLFQGMFEKNILTFNPGWDSNARKLAAFTKWTLMETRSSSISMCEQGYE